MGRTANTKCDVCETPIWVIYQPGYLYIHSWLIGVIWQFITEYKNDKHLVG